MHSSCRLPIGLGSVLGESYIAVPAGLKHVAGLGVRKVGLGDTDCDKRGNLLVRIIREVIKKLLGIKVMIQTSQA